MDAEILSRLNVIRERSQLEGLLSRQRQDWCSTEKLQGSDLFGELERWTKQSNSTLDCFFTYVDEPDTPSNDWWGSLRLYKSFVIQMPDGSHKLHEEHLMTFAH